MAKEMNVKTLGIVGLVSQLKSGQINRDAEMQRSYVWGQKEQTELIDSVFQVSTTYIPPLIGAETEVEIEVKGKLEKGYRPFGWKATFHYFRKIPKR